MGVMSGQGEVTQESMGDMGSHTALKLMSFTGYLPLVKIKCLIILN